MLHSKSITNLGLQLFLTAYKQIILIIHLLLLGLNTTFEIKLIHDMNVASIPDSYILVDTSFPTSVNLGSYNITNLESISFSIGVETKKQ